MACPDQTYSGQVDDSTDYATLCQDAVHNDSCGLAPEILQSGHLDWLERQEVQTWPTADRITRR